MHPKPDNIPSTFNQAMNTPEADEWYKAMQQEINTMHSRKVWVLVRKTDNMKPVGSRWVYNLKRDHENKIIYKARLVAQGFLQRRGETYDEVFSPVVNFSVIRLFFTVFVNHLKWDHCQLDVKAAYLYADLDTNIFMKQPQGFEDAKKPEYVCKLNKALYGLHQSGRQWFKEIHSKLETIGFESLNWVNCVYVYQTEIILLLYVDDIVLIGKNSKVIDKAIDLIMQHFELKVLGKTKKLLGVTFEENGSKITQKEYILKTYEEYKKFNIPIMSLPISKGSIITKDQCPTSITEQDKMKSFPFRNLIGNLSFIASRTRPDIAYVINRLSRVQSNPHIMHWELLLKTLGYLQATCDDRLNLSDVSDLTTTGYSDASYADDLDDRTSTSGYIVLVGNSPISWRTAKQSFVSLSTMESEFVALTEAAKEVSWLSRILTECQNKELLPMSANLRTVLKTDNEAAIFYSNSPVENSRTKHINVKYHFIRNLINDNLFKLEHVKSKSNLADIFTKAPTKNDLKVFKDKIFV